VAIARIPSSASSQPRTQARLNFQNSQTPGTPPAQRVLVRPRPPGNNNGPSQQATSEATPSRQNQNIILVNGQGTRIQRIQGRNNHQRSVSNLNGRTILILNPQRSGTPGGSQTGRAATDSPVTQAQARPLIRPIRVVQNSQSPNVAGGNRPLVPINRGTPVQGQRIISVSDFLFYNKIFIALSKPNHHRAIKNVTLEDTRQHRGHTKQSTENDKSCESRWRWKRACQATASFQYTGNNAQENHCTATSSNHYAAKALTQSSPCFRFTELQNLLFKNWV